MVSTIILLGRTMSENKDWQSSNENHSKNSSNNSNPYPPSGEVDECHSSKPCHPLPRSYLPHTQPYTSSPAPSTPSTTHHQVLPSSSHHMTEAPLPVFPHLAPKKVPPLRFPRPPDERFRVLTAQHSNSYCLATVLNKLQ